MEEQQEKERQKLMEELERRIRQRLELLKQHDIDLRLREDKIQKEKGEESKIREEVCSYFYLIHNLYYKLILSILQGIGLWLPFIKGLKLQCLLNQYFAFVQK